MIICDVLCSAAVFPNNIPWIQFCGHLSWLNIGYQCGHFSWQVIYLYKRTSFAFKVYPLLLGYQLF